MVGEGGGGGQKLGQSHGQYYKIIGLVALVIFSAPDWSDKIPISSS